MSDCLHIWRDNFADIDIVSSKEASSTQSAFPIENAFNKQRRSKVWRSNGFFKIVGGSNTIVFQEDGSTNLTATVSAAEFTSASSLATAIKTALDAAGASTYTVTHDASSNLKFKIVSDGAGGSGTLDLKWATSTAMAGILGYDTVDLTGALSYIADLLIINTEEFILLDFGVPSKPTGFFLVGTRNKPFKFSQDATIKLQANETANFDSPTFSETLAFDENVLAIIRLTGISTTELRFWRIQFVDQNPKGFIEIGAFFLGKEATGITRGAVQFPLRTRQIDRTSTIISEGGQSLSDERDQTQEFILKWDFLKKDEREVLEEIFDFFGKAKPFFLSLDEDAVFSTDFRKMIKLVKFTTEPSYELTRPNIWSMSFNVREEI